MDEIGKLINKPSHYNQYSLECIQFTRQLDGSNSNAFKYIWRLGEKGDEAAQLLYQGKAIFYANDVLAHRIAFNDLETACLMFKDLLTIADEIGADKYTALCAVIIASAGDYTNLQKWVDRETSKHHKALAEYELKQKQKQKSASITTESIFFPQGRSITAPTPQWDTPIQPYNGE